MSCRIPAFSPVPWSDLFPFVQASTSTVPTNIIEHALRQAAAEFLSRTLAFEADMFVDLQAGVKDYDLILPDGYRLQQVRQVCIGDMEYASLSAPPCGDMPCRTYWTDMGGRMLVDYEGCEDLPGGLLVRAALAPTNESCHIDRYVYDRYAEVIAEGALSRILIMPNTPWYNTGTAGIMLRRFQFGMNRAKNDKGREFSGPKQMKAPRFI